MERVTLIVNHGPGDVSSYNALRLAAALTAEDFDVYLFLFQDGVYAAKKGQAPVTGLSELNLETKLNELMDLGVEVACCETCTDARGLAASDLIDGVRIGSLMDLTRSIKQSKHVITL